MPGFVRPDRTRIVIVATLGFLFAAMTSSGPIVKSAEACPDLQAMISEAAAGSTVLVPPCEYRDSFELDRPITLRAEPGAIIDGRDVWTAWDGRTSRDTLPEFDTAEPCESEPACAHRQIVTIDGVALGLVDRSPSTGEFAVDARRHIVLGDDPAGRRVEVVVRQTWMVVSASNVTVEGFTMRYASNAPQTGALRVNPGVNRFTLRDCDLGYAAGANISYGGANDSVVEDCDIHHAGQLGVHLGGDGTNGRNNVLRNSIIRDNNTAGFDPEWEAGGLKATVQTGLRMENNTVATNVGPGLWCDIYCRSIVVTGNRIHHNTHAGIFFEVSTGATISGNRIWENGWGKAVWGWGAGILVSSSGGADVSDNIVAWNFAGISVISQNRQDWNHSVTNNNVHDNLVMAEYDRWAAFWAQDWAGIMFNPASNNRGSANRYWINHAEDGHWRFEWQGGKGSLADFNATPGEQGATYLSDSQKTTILADAGMPTSPVEGHPGEQPSRRTLALIAAAAGTVLLLLFLLASALLIRQRRRRHVATRS